MMLVIYDPSAGFVTGGGWIVSPPGACEFGSCDPTTTGKANFGFVAKYKSGSLKPAGNTQFVFDAGGINFHSIEYDWLVLSKSGGQAQLKGSGSINGQGAPNREDYKFILRAGDGGAGNLVPDTFSIKIWWEEQAVDHVVYDTGR
jgi:hypothetical protein